MNVRNVLILISALAVCCTYLPAANAGDVMFVYSCCIAESIPMDSEGACSQKFCEETVADQIKLWKEAKQTKLAKEEIAQLEWKTLAKEIERAPKKELFDASKFEKSKEDKEKDDKLPQKNPEEEAQATYLAKQKKVAEDDETDTGFVETENEVLEPRSDEMTTLKRKFSRFRERAENPMHHLWPNGFINMAFAGGIQAATQAGFLAAMNNYNRNTCVRFRDAAGAGVAASVTADTSPAGQGSFTNGVGSAATQVNVFAGAPPQDYPHELGHILGFEHTHVRKFRWFYISYDETACFDFFRNLPMCAGNAANDVTNCQHDPTIAFYQQEGFLPASYDKTNATQAADCHKRACGYGWVYQYRQPAGATNYGWYDYGSIMHYPFAIGGVNIPCMTPRAIPYRLQGRPTPGVNGITDKDYGAVNEAYDCRKVEARCKWTDAGNHQHTQNVVAHVHPDWTGQQVIDDLAALCNVPVPKRAGCALVRKTTVLGRRKNVAAGIRSNIPHKSQLFVNC